MKNAFYFILKVLSILNIFKFLHGLYGHVEKNGLIRKIRLISKSMTSQTGQQTIAIQILPNISRSKSKPDNEIWSVNRMEHEKYFFSKIMHKMRQGY